LFGLTPQFKGGIISDHAEVFVNTFQEIFTNDQVLQCVPHIIQKFPIDGKGEGNRQYMKLLENNQTTWLRDLTEEDAYMPRGCRSLEMFEKLKDMILSSLRDSREQCMADTFRDSYLDNVLFNKWRYNVSGIPGCIPQNNSHERSNLDTQGCASFLGIIKSGRNMSSMMNNEFPRLLYINSIERIEVERNFPILDVSKTMKPPLFELFLEFDKRVDCFEDKEGYLVNREYSCGEPINCDQVKRYEETLSGQFELEFSERHVFYSQLNELWYVTKQQLDPKKEPFYMGPPCFYFYNHLSYPHAAVLQHAVVIPALAKNISQEKQGQRKRQKTGLQCAGKYHLRQMEEAHACLSSTDAGVPPRTITTGDQVICYPVSQPDNSIGLV
jgi:hypothetical protein